MADLDGTTEAPAPECDLCHTKEAPNGWFRWSADDPCHGLQVTCGPCHARVRTASERVLANVHRLSLAVAEELGRRLEKRTPGDPVSAPLTDWPLLDEADRTAIRKVAERCAGVADGIAASVEEDGGDPATDPMVLRRRRTAELLAGFAASGRDPDNGVRAIAASLGCTASVPDVLRTIERVRIDRDRHHRYMAELQERITTLQTERDAWVTAAQRAADALDRGQPAQPVTLGRLVTLAELSSVAAFIEGHARRLAGDEWNVMDADSRTDEAAAVHDVLNHLQRDKDGDLSDGRPGAREALELIKRDRERQEGQIVALQDVVKRARGAITLAEMRHTVVHELMSVLQEDDPVNLPARVRSLCAEREAQAIETRDSLAKAAAARSSAPERCPDCRWSNTGLLNYGRPGEALWLCHGCAARRIRCEAPIDPAPVTATPPATHPDGAPVVDCARYLLTCARSWEPGARLLGNIRAEDVARVAEAAIALAAEYDAPRTFGVPEMLGADLSRLLAAARRLPQAVLAELTERVDLAAAAGEAATMLSGPSLVQAVQEQGVLCACNQTRLPQPNAQVFTPDRVVHGYSDCRAAGYVDSDRLAQLTKLAEREAANLHPCTSCGAVLAREPKGYCGNCQPFA